MQSNLKKKYIKLYNINYIDNKSGPSELLIDFEQFSWSEDIPAGPMHLNFKVAKAIREVTGLDIHSCGFDTVYLD